MKIWVDICHTPHVLLFTPIIREFQKRGYTVIITARDCFQTCELLDLRRLDYKIIGKHYGGNKLLKLYGILARTLQLIAFARKFYFKLSLSAGSPYSALASVFLRIPNIIIDDYEHSSVFDIARHTAHRMFFPVYISDDSLRAKGIALEKVLKFPGLKEHIYLSEFTPDKNVLNLLNINREDHIIISFRPPATEAHYHNPKSDRLMMLILEHLKKQSKLIVVVIPRGETQRKQFLEYKARADVFGEELVIPEKAIDTLSLLYYSDLMIGGGGTMNREAVAIGVPTYSFFCGPMGEVDRYLQQVGKLHFITSEEDILTIKVKKKNNVTNHYQNKHELKLFIVQQILESLMGSHKD